MSLIVPMTDCLAAKKPKKEEPVVHLTDEQIWELAEPTLTELTDIMGEDYAKTLLFLRGKQLTEQTAWPIDTPWIAALSADKRMLNDPYVRNQIRSLVKKKIT